MTKNLAADLADHPFLSAFPPPWLHQLAGHACRREYVAGQVLFKEGDAADRLILVREGLITLTIEVPGRGRVDVETLAADAVLGWSWLFWPYKWHLGAVAVERSSVVVFEAPALRALMASEPAIGYELMRRFAAVMLDRLQATRLRLSEQPCDVPSAPICGSWAGETTGAVPLLDIR
jgi:CRP/FNR family transcriptional regulator, cyclic AMP receptor protein